MSTNEMTTTAHTYREIQAEIKALEEQADALKQAMIAEMDTRKPLRFFLPPLGQVRDFPFSHLL